MNNEVEFMVQLWMGNHHKQAECRSDLLTYLQQSFHLTNTIVIGRNVVIDWGGVNIFLYTL